MDHTWLQQHVSDARLNDDAGNLADGIQITTKYIVYL